MKNNHFEGVYLESWKNECSVFVEDLASLLKTEELAKEQKDEAKNLLREYV